MTAPYQVPKPKKTVATDPFADLALDTTGHLTPAPETDPFRDLAPKSFLEAEDLLHEQRPPIRFEPEQPLSTTARAAAALAEYRRRKNPVQPDITQVGHPENTGAKSLTGVRKFGSDVFEAAAGQLENPVKAAASLVTAPVDALGTAAEYGAQTELKGRFAMAGQDPDRVPQDVTFKEGAEAGAQLAALGVAGPMASAIERRAAAAIAERAAAGLATRGLGKGAKVLSHGASGALVGASFTPDEPEVGATLGGLLGAVQAGASGDHVPVKGMGVDRQIPQGPRRGTASISKDPFVDLAPEPPQRIAAGTKYREASPATEQAYSESLGAVATDLAPKPEPVRSTKPREYTPSSIANRTPEQETVRNIAERLKVGDLDAVTIAADEMAQRLPPESILVPLPAADGSTRANRALADAIAGRTGAPVFDVLARTAPVERSTARREAGQPGLTADEHAASFVVNGQLPPNKRVVFVDDVEHTGATAEGARRALGIDADLLVYAQAPLARGEEPAQVTKPRGGAPEPVVVQPREFPHVQGDAGVVSLSDGRDLEIEYAVVDADDIIASHNPLTFQPRPDYPAGVQGRAYHDKRGLAAREAVAQQTAAMRPNLLLDLGEGTEHGPPVVTPDGYAVVGNQRAMMLQRAPSIAPEKYAAYLAELQKRAYKFGITPDAWAGMKKPILVRRLVDPSVNTRDPVELADLNRVSDTPAAKAKDVLSEASSRAGALQQAPDALAHFSKTFNPESTLREYMGTADGQAFAKQLVADGVIAPQEVGRYIAPSGHLTEPGATLVEGMMRLAAVPNVDIIQRAPPSMLRQLDGALPSIALTNTIPGYELGEIVGQALDIAASARANNMDIDLYLAQRDIFAPEESKHIARFLEDASKRKTTEVFRKYATLATEARASGDSIDAFGWVPDERIDMLGKLFNGPQGGTVREGGKPYGEPTGRQAAQLAWRNLVAERFEQVHGRRPTQDELMDLLGKDDPRARRWNAMSESARKAQLKALGYHELTIDENASRTYWRLQPAVRDAVGGTVVREQLKLWSVAKENPTGPEARQLRKEEFDIAFGGSALQGQVAKAIRPAVLKLQQKGLPTGEARAVGVANAPALQVTMVGMDVSTPERFRAAATILRHPQAEHFSYILRDTETGNAVEHVILTSGMLGHVELPLAQLVRQIAERVAAFGGPERVDVLFAHNHPSGHVPSSTGDRMVTLDLEAMLRKERIAMAGHLITDHDVGNWITIDPNLGFIDERRLRVPGADQATWKTAPQLGTDKEATPGVVQPSDLAAMVRDAIDPDAVSVLYLDSQKHIIAVVPVPRALGLQALGQQIAAQIPSMGAEGAVVIAPGQDARTLATEAARSRHGTDPWGNYIIDVLQVYQNRDALTPSFRSLSDSGDFPGPRENEGFDAPLGHGFGARARPGHRVDPYGFGPQAVREPDLFGNPDETDRQLEREAAAKQRQEEEDAREREQGALFTPEKGSRLADAERAARAEIARLKAELPSVTKAMTRATDVKEKSKWALRRRTIASQIAELEKLASRNQAISADEMRARAAAENDGMLFERVKAYHGTPHTFDKFSLDAIGTGEGAQAYGHGLYFAGKKEVAEFYREKLSAPRYSTRFGIRDHGQVYNELFDLIRDGVPKGQLHPDHVRAVARQALDALDLAKSIDVVADEYTAPEGREVAWDIAMNYLRDLEAKPVKGRLYEVDLPDEDTYLLWDKPLSEQPQKVQDALRAMRSNGLIFDQQFGKFGGKDVPLAPMTGKEAYAAIAAAKGMEKTFGSGDKAWSRRVSDDAAASDFLAQHGINGIKYLDGASRHRPLRDIKREFLAELPEDAEFADVEELIGTGRFSPANDAILKALVANDWLGFDYPAQAISAALGGSIDLTEAPDLRKAISAAQDAGTYNYVLFRDDDINIKSVSEKQKPYGSRGDDELQPFETPAVLAERAKTAALPFSVEENSPKAKAFRVTLARETYGSGAPQKNREAWIILGHSGAGKSTLAEQLDREHGAMVIDPDPLKAKFRAFYQKEFGRDYSDQGVHRDAANVKDQVLEKVGKTELDRYAMSDAINAKVKDREDEYHAWLDQQLAPFFANPKVPVGRKKLPYTLENVTEAATRGGINGAEETMTHGPGKVRAHAAQRFSDINHARNASYRIKPEAEVKAAIGAMTKEDLEPWRTEMLQYNDRGDGMGATWDGLDAMHEALSAFAKRRLAPNPETRMRAALFKAGFKNVPKDLIKESIRIVSRIIEQPTDYFEGKPQRAVTFDEFAGALIPKTAKPIVRQILEKRGIPFREYDSSDQNSRSEVLKAFRRELYAEGHSVLKEEKKPYGKKPSGFDQWFKNSQVVDEDGRPKVVYHATRADFEAFRPGSWFAENPELAEQFYNTRRGNIRKGGGRRMYPVYLSIQNALDLRALPIGTRISVEDWTKLLGMTPAEYLARAREINREETAKLSKDAGRIHYFTDAWGSLVGSIYPEAEHAKQDFARAPKPVYQLLDSPVVRQIIEEQGFDGIRTKETNSGDGRKKASVTSDTWQAFRPEQIKSAFGNDGTFNSEDPNILREEKKPYGSKSDDLAQAERDIDALEREWDDLVDSLHRNGLHRGSIGLTDDYRAAEKQLVTKRLAALKRRDEIRRRDARQVYAAVTETPRFKRWFGDSKVVDDDGHPLRMFHGTGADITEFKGGMGRRKGVHSQGIWFTASADKASEYAEYSGEGDPNVIPVFLSIKNPARLSWEEMAHTTVADLKAKGYDGVYDMTDGAWVAFDPQQIKSAISAKDFDPSEASILREEKKPYGPARNMSEPAKAAFATAAEDIDFSGRAAGMAKLHKGTWVDKLNRFADGLANGLGPIERLGQMKEVDEKLKPSENPLDLLSYAKSSDHTVKRFFEEGTIDPITREVTGPSFKSLFQPFNNDVDRIRDALTFVMQERILGRGLKGVGGDKQRYERAKLIVEEGRKDAALVHFKGEWEKFVSGIGEYAVGTGLWSQDFWKRLQKSDALYVRFKRILEEDVETAAGIPPEGYAGADNKRMANVGPGVKRFYGSKRMIMNPAEAMAEYAASVIRRADRYRVGAALFNAADALGDAGGVVIQRLSSAEVTDKFGPKMTARTRANAKKLGLDDEAIKELVETFDVRFDERNPIIWRNGAEGKREYAEVNSPELWKAVAALNTADDGALRAVLDVTIRPLRRVFVATTTGLNPRFALATNLLRDIPDALAKSQSGIRAGDIVKGYTEAAKGVFGASELAKTAANFGLGNVSMFAQETHARPVARRFAPTSRVAKARNAVAKYNPIGITIRGLEHVGSASDVAPRHAEFLATLRKYRPKVESGEWTMHDLYLRAATRGRPVSMDFANKPGNAVARFYADYVPFAGPALQAPVVMARAVGRNPGRVAGVAAGIALLTLIAWAMKHEAGKDVADVINDRKSAERAGFIILPLDDEGTVGRIPLPQEFGVLSTMITASLDKVMEDDPRAGRLLQAAIVRALPPGIGEAVDGRLVVPIPGVQQLLENRANEKDFDHRPVESRAMQSLPVEERRLETTSPTFDALAAFARRPKHKLGLGLPETSPVKAENFVRGITSSATDLITAATDPVASKITDRPVPGSSERRLRDYPLNPASALVKGPSSSTESEEDYYVLRQRVNEVITHAKRSTKAKDEAALERLTDDQIRLLKPDVAQLFRSVDKQLEKMKDAEAQIRAQVKARAIEGDVAREARQAIRMERQQLLRAAVDQLRQLGNRP